MYQWSFHRKHERILLSQCRISWKKIVSIYVETFLNKIIELREKGIMIFTLLSYGHIVSIGILFYVGVVLRAFVVPILIYESV